MRNPEAPTSAAAEDLAATGSLLRSPGALVGFVGCAALSLAGTSQVFSRDPGGWGWGPVDRLGSHLDFPQLKVLFLAGTLLLLFGWWLLRPSGVPRPRSGHVLSLWALPFLIVPPALSSDAAFYADVGWTQNQGLDRSRVDVGSLGSPYAHAVDPLWTGIGSPYPPLSSRAAQLGVILGGEHPYWGIVAQRWVGLIAIAVIALLLPKIGRHVGVSPAWTAWFGVLNPGVLIHYVGGAHNDALMVAGIVVALWATIRLRERPRLAAAVGAAVVGAAMAFKPQAGLAVVDVAALSVVSWRGPTARLRDLVVRLVATTVAALVSFAAICVASGLGFGWAHWLYVPGSLPTLTPAFLLGDLVQRAADLFGASAGWAPDAAKWLSLVVAAAGLAWLVVTRWRQPLQVTAWGLVIVSFASTTQPWYPVAGLVLLGATRLSKRTARITMLVSMAYVGGAAFAGFRQTDWETVSRMVALGLAMAVFHAVFGRRTSLVGPPIRLDEVATPG